MRWSLVAVLLGAVRPTAADAPPGRYQINPPEVRDTKTGLTWAQVVPSTGGDDGAGGYAWANAISFCPTLGTGWRLPTVKEILTLVDDSKPTGPAIDETAFPGTPAGGFWTSTPFAGSPPNNAWWVTFGYGGAGNDSVNAIYKVRCVR